MKIGDPKAKALEQLERAHQKSGAHSQSIRDAAEKFWSGVDGGGILKEPRLKLRLLLSPSEKPAISELARILFQSGDNVSTRQGNLEKWMSDNKSLFGAMSGGTQSILKQIASGKDDAHKIDAEIARAESAVEQAFGKLGAPQRKAIDRLAFEATIEGAVQVGWSADVRRLGEGMMFMFAPGSKAAIEELAQALEKPQTSGERYETYRAWTKKHPSLMEALLTNHGGALGQLQNDLSVHKWSDDKYRAARQAVFDAFAAKSAA